jgi:hypothetical protein
MSDGEAHQIILDLLAKLETKLDNMEKSMHNLDKKVALIERDKAWGRWLVGGTSSIITLIFGALLSKYMR